MYNSESRPDKPKNPKYQKPVAESVSRRKWTNVLQITSDLTYAKPKVATKNCKTI
jgi:hypothetical protein